MRQPPSLDAGVESSASVPVPGVLKNDWSPGARRATAPVVPAGQLVWVAMLGAVLGWFALWAQLWVLLEVRRDQGLSVWGGFGNFFSYFTILTNLIVAVVLTVHATWPRGRWSARLSGAFVSTGVAANILLVGIAYSLLLRHLSQPTGLHWIANELLHDVIPPFYLGYWWAFTRREALGYGAIAYWAVYPALYFVGALLRGSLIGRYPYPFINVANLGLGQVALNACGILAGFALLASCLVAIARWRFRRTARAEQGVSSAPS